MVCRASGWSFVLTNGSVWHSGLFLVIISKIYLSYSLLSKQHTLDYNKGNRKYGRFSLAKPPLTCRDYSQNQNVSLSLPSTFVSLTLYPSLHFHSEHTIQQTCCIFQMPPSHGGSDFRFSHSLSCAGRVCVKCMCSSMLGGCAG